MVVSELLLPHIKPSSSYFEAKTSREAFDQLQQLFASLPEGQWVTAENLIQFAIMGEVFARNVLGLDHPSVGILNVGQEDLKGNSAVKLASAPRSRETSLKPR